MSGIASVLGEAARQACAPVIWRAAASLVALVIIAVAMVAALGFAMAGCYLLILEIFGLPPVGAAFIVAGALLVVALIAGLVLRRNLYGGGAPTPRAQVAETVSEEARRTAALLQAETADVVARRPGACLLACAVAGLVVGVMRRPPR